MVKLSPQHPQLIQLLRHPPGVISLCHSYIYRPRNILVPCNIIVKINMCHNLVHLLSIFFGTKSTCLTPKATYQWYLILRHMTAHTRYLVCVFWRWSKVGIQIWYTDEISCGWLNYDFIKSNDCEGCLNRRNSLKSNIFGRMANMMKTNNLIVLCLNVLFSSWFKIVQFTK